MPLPTPQLLAAALALLGAGASADPLVEIDGLRRNGALSRHLWAPGATSTDLGAMRLSAGLAIGLRGGVRANLGAAVAPALTLQLPARNTSVSLLSTGSGNTMLVLQLSR